MDPTSVLRLPRGFDRSLKLLLFSMASRRIVMGFLMVVRAIYFNLLGFSPLTIGLILSFASAVSALHHISFGVLSDRYGRKPFLLLGAVFATSRLVIFAITRNFWLLTLGQGLGAMGEGAGAGQPVVSGYITDRAELRERVSIFSTIAITNAIAASIGSVLAGLPQVFQSLLGLDLVSAHTPLFWIGVSFSALSFVLILPIQDESTREDETGDDRGMFKPGSRSVIAKFSLVRSTSGFGWGLIESLLSLYFFMRFAVGSDMLGPLYAVARIASIFTYLLIPTIVSRFGEIGTLTLSRLLTAGITVAFALTNWYPLAAVLLIFFRTLIMFPMPVRQSFATGIVDPDETATAIGISNFARMGVRSVAPAFAGYLFEAVSLSMPFMMGAVLMGANGLLYHAFFRPEKK